MPGTFTSKVRTPPPICFRRMYVLFLHLSRGQVFFCDVDEQTTRDLCWSYLLIVSSAVLNARGSFPAHISILRREKVNTNAFAFPTQYLYVYAVRGTSIATTSALSRFGSTGSRRPISWPWRPLRPQAWDDLSGRPRPFPRCLAKCSRCCRRCLPEAMPSRFSNLPPCRVQAAAVSRRD